MQLFLISFLLSWAVTYLIIHYSHLHASYTQDHTDGVQKYHDHPVPRIGGVGILCALWASLLFLYLFRDGSLRNSLILFTLALFPYGSGLYEDVSKSTTPFFRLIMAVLGAIGGAVFLDAALIRLDIPGVDTWLYAWWPLALLVTAIAVAGLTQSFNIIDGFNGLASFVGMSCLLALAYVAWKVHDPELVNVCFAALGGVLGFFFFNWPGGRIFLGDGGAYLLGFIVAEISVLLVVRHAEVSAWFPFSLMLYPILETVFSMYRRRMRGLPMSHPDSAHFHTLIFRRLVYSFGGGQSARGRVWQNSMAAPYLWYFHSLTAVPALLFWRSTPWLVASAILFVLCYLWLYRRIVRFRIPHILK